MLKHAGGFLSGVNLWVLMRLVELVAVLMVVCVEMDRLCTGPNEQVDVEKRVVFVSRSVSPAVSYGKVDLTV